MIEMILMGVLKVIACVVCFGGPYYFLIYLSLRQTKAEAARKKEMDARVEESRRAADKAHQKLMDFYAKNPV